MIRGQTLESLANLSWPCVGCRGSVSEIELCASLFSLWSRGGAAQRKAQRERKKRQQTRKVPEADGERRPVVPLDLLHRKLDPNLRGAGRQLIRATGKGGGEGKVKRRKGQTVALYTSKNLFSTYLLMKHVLPTLASPMMMNLALLSSIPRARLAFGEDGEFAQRRRRDN